MSKKATTAEAVVLELFDRLTTSGKPLHDTPLATCVNTTKDALRVFASGQVWPHIRLFLTSRQQQRYTDITDVHTALPPELMQLRRNGRLAFLIVLKRKDGTQPEPLILAVTREGAQARVLVWNQPAGPGKTLKPTWH